MNKIERVRATLAGRPVDRPPFTVWYHFGNQHAPAERTAQMHLEFFDHYDLDLLKLMNDYDYSMPAGLEVVATAEDLGRHRVVVVVHELEQVEIVVVEELELTPHVHLEFFDHYDLYLLYLYST